MLTFKNFSFIIGTTLLFCSLNLQAAEKKSTPESSKESVVITNAWVRPSNPGQEVGAAYMTLTSKQDATLLSVESDATKSIEIHSMTMKAGIMKMRMLDALPLPAGKAYKLAPGGFHLMLFDLKKPLNVGDTVNFTLHFKNKNNVEFKQTIKAKVKAETDIKAATK